MSYLWNTIKRRDPEDKKQFTRTDEVNNFYGKEPLGQQLKRFHFIHYVFKYKLVVPIIIILKRVLGKRLVKKVSDEPQFDMVKQFETIWDESVLDWSEIYLNSLNKKKGREEYHRQFYRGQYRLQPTGSIYLLRTMKEIALTGMMNDDAYTEFITFFMWRTYLEMSKRVAKGDTNHFMRSVPDKMDSDEEIAYYSLQKMKVEGQYKMFKAGVQK